MTALEGVPPPVATTAVLAFGDLAVAGLVAELRDGFVEEAHAVRAALRELAAVRVERERAVEGDRAPAVDPVLRLAEAAEAERLDPRDAVEREPVVQQGDVDVVGGQRRARPQMRRRPDHLRLVGDRVLVPRQPFGDLGARRLDADRRMRQVAGDIGGADDDGHRPVARHVAVVQAERRRDHPSVDSSRRA